MTKINKEKILQLSLGIIGIYTFYFINAILQQAVMTKKYQNIQTGQMEVFSIPYAQIIIVTFSTYFYGSILNRILYKKQQINIIPWQKSIKCGACVTISVVSYSYAIHFLNFPIVMMARSCNLLSTVIVAALMTGVEDKSLQIGKQKIIISLIIIIGMTIFTIYDPNWKKQQIHLEQYNYYGVVLIIVSLISDGFLPDFQAVIKSKYKPHPTVLMAEVNKWGAIFSTLYSVGVNHFTQIFYFIINHKDILFDLFLIGILTFLGQIVIYNMIKLFKQHILPFIITTRKIFTVGISILYFGHQINPYQIFGILIVLFSCVYQFINELSQKPIVSLTNLPSPKKQNKNQ